MLSEKARQRKENTIMISCIELKSQNCHVLAHIIEPDVRAEGEGGRYE